jgi:hypothetical protein
MQRLPVQVVRVAAADHADLGIEQKRALFRASNSQPRWRRLRQVGSSLNNHQLGARELEERKEMLGRRDDLVERRIRKRETT